jgi:uncharacterized membrane protein YphA (DoxX/SURF4 family)
MSFPPTLTETALARRGRAGRITLWVVQVALAVVFLFAGISKLVGQSQMVTLFGQIGFGQWFRYFTGCVEVSAAIALLVPSLAVFGAVTLVATMIGAVATNLFLGQSPLPPAILLLVAAAVVWIRRRQLFAGRATR